MTVKVADLTIEEREWPLIVHAATSDIIHISKVNGKKEFGRTYQVTECNRALDWPDQVNNIGDWNDWKFCSRCGTKKDFKAIFIEMRKRQKEYWRIRDEQRKTESEAYRREATEDQKQLSSLADALYKDGYIVETEGEKVFIDYTNGRRFELVVTR